MTYDREKIDGLGSKDVMKLINKHMADVVPDLQRNMDYYLGKQAITERERTATAANVTAPNAQPQLRTRPNRPLLTRCWMRWIKQRPTTTTKRTR